MGHNLAFCFPYRSGEDPSGSRGRLTGLALERALCKTFGGERVNVVALSLDEKLRYVGEEHSDYIMPPFAGVRARPRHPNRLDPIESQP